MSKKIIILIQLVVCVSAVVIISFFGRNPEIWRDFQYCESIHFTINGERVESGTEVELEHGTKTYQLEWVILPDEATMKDVVFICESDNVSVNESGLVEFLTDDEGATIIIKTKDESNLSSEITLTIKPDHGGELPL